MGLLKYIDLKCLDGVKLNPRPLADYEANILDQNQGVRHEGCPTGVHPEVQGGGDKIPHENEMGPLGNETLSNDGKRQPQEPELLGSCSKRRKLVKARLNVVTDSRSSSHDSPENEDDNNPSKGGEISTTRSGNKKTISEPEESSDWTNAVPESDLQVLDQVGCLAQLVGYVPELVKNWYDKKTKTEARLRDRVSGYRLRMKFLAAKNAKLVKKVRKLKNLKTATLDKCREAIRMLAENTIEHKKVVEGLEKELEIARAQNVENEEKLKKAHEEIQLEKEKVEELKQQNEEEARVWEAVAEGWRQERVSLEASLERVSTERRWLIEEGFGYVINRLHQSQEYSEPLAAVESNFFDWGAYYGLIKGYKSCKDGVALEDVSLYKPQAHKKLLEAVHKLNQTRFPYIVALSQCTNCSLDELRALEPIGLEEDGGDW